MRLWRSTIVAIMCAGAVNLADAQVDSQPAEAFKALLLTNAKCLSLQSSYLERRFHILEEAKPIPNSYEADSVAKTVPEHGPSPIEHFEAILILHFLGARLSEPELADALQTGESTYRYVLLPKTTIGKVNRLFLEQKVQDGCEEAYKSAKMAASQVVGLDPNRLDLTLSDLNRPLDSPEETIVTLEFVKDMVANIPESVETRKELKRFMIHLFINKEATLSGGEKFQIKDSHTQMVSGMAIGTISLRYLIQQDPDLAGLFVDYANLNLASKLKMHKTIANYYYPEWRKSRKTNQYLPIRDALLRSEVIQSRMTSKEAANTYSQFTYEGMKLIDEHASGGVPDNFYSGFRTPQTPKE